jgi:hypothetical protein
MVMNEQLRWARWGLALAVGAAALAAPAAAQSGWISRITGVLTGQPGVGPLTQREADQGVREALRIAAAAAGDRLAVPGGFLDQPRIRIPLPGALARTQARLKPFGLSGPLDEMEVGLNRAAEAAMPEAKRLALEAVRTMTLGDALAIVRGGDAAATTFLRQKTEASLATALRPRLQATLDQAGVFAAIDRLRDDPMTRGLVNDARRDVTEFATRKALDGFYLTLADEERVLRSDPARRTSEILRRVFGGGSS